MKTYEMIKQLDIDNLASLLAGIVLTSVASTLAGLGIDPQHLSDKDVFDKHKEQMLAHLNEEVEDGAQKGTAASKDAD